MNILFSNYYIKVLQTAAWSFKIDNLVSYALYLERVLGKLASKKINWNVSALDHHYAGCTNKFLFFFLG